MKKDVNDVELVRLMRLPETRDEAFKVLYERYRNGFIKQFSPRCGRGLITAYDLYQNVMIKAYRAITEGDFDENKAGGGIRGWMTTVGMNELNQDFHKESRFLDALSNLLREKMGATAEENRYKDYNAEEMFDLIERVLNKLHKCCGNLLRLYYLEEKSLKDEVFPEMKACYSTYDSIKQAMQRCKEKFRQAL